MIGMESKIIKEQIKEGIIATVFGSSVLSEELLSQGYLEDKNWLSFIPLLSVNNIAILNGGYQASMSMISNQMIKHNGQCYGIVSSSFSDPCIKEHYTNLFFVKDAFERLKTLIWLGDFYIFLPGGIGSLQEITATLWCIDRGFIAPRKLYFLGEYWAPILNSISSYSLMFKALKEDNIIQQPKSSEEFINSLIAHIAYLKNSDENE